MQQQQHHVRNARGHAKWVVEASSALASAAAGDDDDNDDEDLRASDAAQSAQQRWRQRYSQSVDFSRPDRTAFIGSKTASSRQVNLHAYNGDISRRSAYVETKIGGHALDHKRFFYPDWQQIRQPLKTAAFRVAADVLWGSATSSERSSPAYQITKHDVLNYAATKIGGHPLDHVPFINRGQPSRPLLGYVAPRLSISAQPVFPRSSSVILRATLEQQTRVLQSIGRNPAHLYDCSRCLRMRQSARVQLVCSHSICSACVSSKTMNHVEAGEFCFLECSQCSEFIAIEAIVFINNYAVRINAPMVRTLAEFVKIIGNPKENVRTPSASSMMANAMSGASSSPGWKYGGIVAVLAFAAGKLGSRQSKNRMKKAQHAAIEVEEDSNVKDVATLAKHGGTVEGTIENGAIRWQKRVVGLAPPSRLLKYKFVRTLGIGNFAEVILVKHRKGKLSVLKESDKLQEAVNEIRILSKIQSPYVVRIFEYFIEEVGHRHFAYIDMEYCDRGDLVKLLTEKGALDAATFESLFRQLCLGLQEIHAHGIIHRDLKPGNVLLTSDGIAKIADFGVSTCLESDLLTHHAAGTVAFMAPEVRRYFLGEDVSYDTKADIWSLGALAFAMLTGNPEPRVATRPLDELIGSLREQGIDEKHVSLVEKTLHQVPSGRANLQELLSLIPVMNSKL
uniref:Protein kinase domain-containing protein n=1 Tax=Globisporangium ultimum (strain ATCC 200006 / CBS 805.95 / DAOM BR144) TaxID=431595 RepID=K3WB19_GLOUD